MQQTVFSTKPRRSAFNRIDGKREVTMKERWLLIRGGTVLDGSGRASAPTTDVVIRNNRIVAVGDDISPGVTPPPKEQMEAIDATGRTVMPGLIDLHCHMSYGESRTEEEID